MLSGMGVAGHIVMGTVIRLESEQLSDMEKYLENTYKTARAKQISEAVNILILPYTI